MKASVIGSGIGGLAAAIRLRKMGYEVDLFEAKAALGGKLGEIKEQGFRFDWGPSLFTMPELLNELFELSNEKLSNVFEYEKLDCICNYFWEDKTTYKAYSNKTKFNSETEKVFGREGLNEFNSFLNDATFKYTTTSELFLDKSLQKFTTWTNKTALKAYLKLPKLNLMRSMNRHHERFSKNKKLIQLFNRYATYNGSNPYKASALLSMIPHIEFNLGAYYPKNGMRSIINALEWLCRKKGVNIFTNHNVEQIITEKSKVTGIRTNGEIKKYDVIVSNMDMYYTYTKLLNTPFKNENHHKKNRSSSALVFYWGIKKTFPELDLHNILFSENYKAEFEHITNGKIFNNPTIYINITSKHSPADAPEGCENWFTMINVPYNNGQDWDKLIIESKKNIISKINRTLNCDIESLICYEKITDPRTIDTTTQSYAGSIYGTHSNNMMSAFLRHPNYSKNIKGLYFCGGSVHPGGGIPLALKSAKIASEVIQKKYNK